LVMTTQATDVPDVWEYVVYEFDNSVQEPSSEIQLVSRFAKVDGFEMREVLNREVDMSTGVNVVYCVF
jgi:hypothetical protein